MHNLVGPIFKAIWIKYGLQEGRLEVTVMCAAVMVVIQLVSFRANMLYSGRWDVQRKMQMLLVRKYLSLDELDLLRIGNVEEQFRHAILRTASRLSSECYQALHSALSSCFAILFALGYTFSPVPRHACPFSRSYASALFVPTHAHRSVSPASSHAPRLYSQLIEPL